MADLGTLRVALVANLQKFTAGMKTATKAVKTFGERVGKTMLRAGAMIRAFTAGSTRLLKRFGTAMIRFFRIAIPAAMALSIRELAKFQEQMAFVNTMLDDQTEHLLPAYTRAIKDMAVEFGEGTATLSRGLFDILSASIDASKAIEVLTVSVKAAKAGMTDTAVAADAITTLLNSYGLEAEQASNVSDILFAIIKKGKTTFAELAPNIGKVAAIAAVAQVNMADMGAALATMTRAGLRTEIAITSLRAITLAFLKPQSDSVEMAKKFGIELNSNTLKAGGLTRVMQKLKTATAEELAVIIPSARAIAGFASAIQQAGKMADDYDFILNSVGKSQEAYEKQTASLMFKLQRLWQITRLLAVEFGNVLAPVVEAFINWVIPRQEDWRKSLQNFADFAKSDFGAAIKIGLNVVQEIFIGFGKALFLIMKHAVLGLLDSTIWDPFRVGVVERLAFMREKLRLTLEHPLSALLSNEQEAANIRAANRAAKLAGELEARILGVERANRAAAASTKTLTEELIELGNATTKAISILTAGGVAPLGPLFPDQGKPGEIANSLNEAATAIGNATGQMQQDLENLDVVVTETVSNWTAMWQDAAGSIAGSMRTAWADMILQAKSGTEIVAALVQQMARSIIEASFTAFVQPGIMDIFGLISGRGIGVQRSPATRTAEFFSGGGVVKPVYAATGFVAKGTDTVPAMLTPGEVVLPKEIVELIGNSGGSITFNVNAIDAQNTAQWLNNNKRLIAGMVYDTSRGNNPASRRLGN